MNLAIKGHATRGNEVIEILEMLGGKNDCNYGCDVTSYIYSIDKKGTINWHIPHPNSPLAIFTLEGFLEMFPHKVGDRVLYTTYGVYSRIKSMLWNEEKERVIYRLDSKKLFVATADELQPYKEQKTMEEKGTLIQIDLTREWRVADEVELILGDYEFVLKDGKTYFVRKKPQYPKTYEECAQILLERASVRNDIGYKGDLLIALQRLLVCRDAYWKIAGEEMGLGKPWEPVWTKDTEKYVIYPYKYLYSIDVENDRNTLLAFPTREMRDVFLENFKELIELVKELL